VSESPPAQEPWFLIFLLHKGAQLTKNRRKKTCPRKERGARARSGEKGGRTVRPRKGGRPIPRGGNATFRGNTKIGPGKGKKSLHKGGEKGRGREDLLCQEKEGKFSKRPTEKGEISIHSNKKMPEEFS